MLDTHLLHLHLPRQGVQPAYQPGDPPIPYPKVKQVELDELILMQVTLILKHKEILAASPEMVPSASNPTSWLAGLFVYSECPAKPYIQLVYLVQVYVLDLHPLLVVLDFVSFPPASAHELLAL
jgi:hypothetical protein